MQDSRPVLFPVVSFTPIFSSIFSFLCFFRRQNWSLLLPLRLPLQYAGFEVLEEESVAGDGEGAADGQKKGLLKKISLKLGLTDYR